jgi:hypothetical protein
MSFSERLSGTIGQSLLVGSVCGAGTLLYKNYNDFIAVGSMKVPIPLFVGGTAAVANIWSDSVSGFIRAIPYVGDAVSTQVDALVVPASVVGALIVTNPQAVTNNPQGLLTYGLLAYAGNMAANYIMPTSLSNNVATLNTNNA